MKILSAPHIKEADAYTIANEPITSINLMERASMACFKRLIKLIHPNENVFVFCGKGNNGGDGLAIARLLREHGMEVTVALIHYSESFSPDAKTNYERFVSSFPNRLTDVHSDNDLQKIKTDSDTIVIDALLGTGINKPVEGLLADVITLINKLANRVISIDVPSGLFIDESSYQNKYIVESDLTLSLQLPKLAYLLPQNKTYVPEFELVNIGLNITGIAAQPTEYYYITTSLISSLLKKRDKFSHKGNFGHALLVAGSKGKSGAAVISAKACLRSGAGLLTVHSTQGTLQSLTQQLPEAMTSEDSHPDYITEIIKPENYNAIAIGPGIGTQEDSQTVLKKILQYSSGQLVIDADGLNILSENKTWLNFLPPNTILTPHPKEFERLTQKHTDDFDRLNTLKKFSISYNCIVILKGAHSAIAMPDGNVFFNSTGNAALAKAGSGDGLTGIVLGLLSRGYNAPQAAIIGTFIHGYAADMFVKKKSAESMLISDLIELLPKAFYKLENKKAV